MKTRIVRFVEASFRRLGFALVPYWRLGSISQEVYLRHLFELLRIDCVVDVGANLGQYRDFLRNRVGYDGLIVSIEPIPDHVDVLRERALRDRKWLIENCALGAASGVAPFNVMKTSVFSSFLAPNRSSTNQFSAQNQIDRTIEVQLKKLDDMLPTLLESTGSKRPYLKLDTQGFDLQVIEGGKAILPQMLALQTEASIIPIYVGMPDYKTTIRTLEELGFRIGGMFPVHPDAVLQLVEFDCHMVNASQCPP